MRHVPLTPNVSTNTIGHLKTILLHGALLAVLALIAGTAIAPAANAACENESLRAELNSSFLPDCMAYEKVSPPYKEGYLVQVESFASNGNSAIVHSFANLAGTQGSSEKVETSSVYLAKRNSDGWELSPMNASRSEFIGQYMLANEPDNGLSLWMQHTPEQGALNRGLWLRSPEGKFTFIGPLSPSTSEHEEPSDVMDGNKRDIDPVRAATADYGHILMQADYPPEKWSFDETDMEAQGRTSLYEYSGTGNAEPTLVGVVGPRGSRELIAKCGTGMGAGDSGSSFNALSGDGETIFFTVNQCSPGPATAELYARKHGAVNGMGAAETIDVSESECTIGAPECEQESGKNFEGASEDGRLAYFTSTQKLTDEAVDGTASGDASSGRGCAEIAEKATGTPPKGSGCNLYLYDFAKPAGSRLKVVSTGGEVMGVARVAGDGSRVYYVSRVAIGSAGANVYGALPEEGQPNMYVYDAATKKTVFVVTLGLEDEDWLRNFVRTVQITGPGGRFLLFASSKPGLTTLADDTSSVTQLFEYRAPGEGEGGKDGEAAELVRVTKGEDGFNEDGNGVNIGINKPFFASRDSKHGADLDFKTTSSLLNVSADGHVVAFQTAGRLSVRATSPLAATLFPSTSLYEFRTAGALSEGSVHLVSDGQDIHSYKGLFGVQFQGIDATGDNVLFRTGDPLLASDLDGGQFDTYDARVEGGFAPPSRGASCEAGDCEAPFGPPPALALPDSTVLSGAGNVTLPPTVVVRGGKPSPRSARAVKLARALRACRRGSVRHRRSCEALARRRYKSRTARRGGRNA